MKTKITQNIKAIILGLALTVGMGYAAAQTFTGPTCSPTDAVGCNTPAPLNVGEGIQSKLGSLRVNTSLTNPATYGLDVWGITRLYGGLQIGTGTPTNGKVLTATDSLGNVTWTTPTSPVSSMVVFASSPSVYTSTSHTWTVPAGAKFARVTVVGGGVRTTSGSQSTYTGSCDGGAAVKTISLNGGSMSIVVGSHAPNQWNSTLGNSSVTYGGDTVTATGAPAYNINSGNGACGNGVGQNGDLNGTGPYFGYGSGGSSSMQSKGGLVVIEYY